MRVLVACEFSGTVRDAFIRRGHDAMSCDLLPSESSFGPHYQGSVLDILGDGWDLMIAHPPCTYLSRAGARWMIQRGVVNEARLAAALEAKAFFLELLNCPIGMIALENPTPLRIVNMPPSSQSIQPFEFGDPYSKKTYLWLKNLPPLMSTRIMAQHRPYIDSGGGKKKTPRKYKGARKQDRSRTFLGIAEAMADQWGNYDH